MGCSGWLRALPSLLDLGLGLGPPPSPSTSAPPHCILYCSSLATAGAKVDLCLEILRAWQEEGVPGRRRRRNASVKILGGEKKGEGVREGGKKCSPLVWRTFKIIWFPHFVLKETELWVGCDEVGAVVTCQRMHRAPETLCLERGGSRGPCRSGQAMLVTIPAGGMGGEVWGSWVCAHHRRFRSQGWLRLVSSCSPYSLPHLSPHHTKGS